MAANDWVDGSDLAGMSRGGNLLQQMGYDPDEVRANPAMRADLMGKLASPYSATGAQRPTMDLRPVDSQAPGPVLMAQNSMPPRPGTPMLNPRSPNGNDITQPAGRPQLINRQQPTVPAPAPQPVPDTLGPAASGMPTQASMAGATPPTSAAVSPSGTPAPSTESQNSLAAVKNLLSPEPDLPDTTKQDAMIAAKSLPINPNTSIGGKKIYKEGFWGEVGRGLNDARLGFAGRPDLVTPYGAPNSQYGQDDQMRKAQLDLAEKQKGDAMARFKEQVDLRKNQGVDSAKAGEISNTAAKLPNETTTANADMQRAQASTAEAYNSSPAGKAEADKELNTQTLANRQGQLSDRNNPLSRASTADKAFFIATGKLPDPDRYHAPPEQRLFDAAHSAWVAQNPGKQPGLDDIRSMVEASRGADKGTMMMVPDGKGGTVAKMIHSGDEVPAGSTLVSGKGGPADTSRPASTVADKNRASLAHVANDNLDQVEDIINRRPEIVGKLGGLISQASDLIGSNDPDLVALGNAVHNFAMANAGIHGSRSHENVVDAEKELINNMKSGVQGIQGGIKANRSNLKAIIERVEGAPKATPNSGAVNPEDYPEAN